MYEGYLEISNIDKIPVNKYANNTEINEVCIQEGVTEIDEAAFYNCTNLQVVHLPETLEKISVCAFHNCINLKIINIPKKCKIIEDFAFTNINSDIQVVRTPKQFDKIKFGVGNNIILNAKITKGVYVYRGKLETGEKELMIYDNLKVFKSQIMYNSCKLTEVSLSSFKKAPPGYSEGIFTNLYECKKIDVSRLDVSNFKTLRNCFASCKSLQYIDLSNWKTKNVEDLCGMFYECNVLKNVDLSSFDFSKVRDMSYMFEDCYSLRKISFPTQNIVLHLERFTCCFYNCASLKSIDLSNFALLNSLNMSEAFNECDNLEEVKLFRISNNDSIFITWNMFEDCEKLTKLILNKKINLRYNKTRIYQDYNMFANCPLEKEKGKYIEII